MAERRIRFVVPQVVGALPAEMLVSEVVIEADRVVYLSGPVTQLDVDPALIAWDVPNEVPEGVPDVGRVERARPANEGKGWSAEEVAALGEAWASGVRRTRELAERHQRSVGAIRSRLRMMGLREGGEA